MKDVKIKLKTVSYSDGKTELAEFEYMGRYDRKDGGHYLMYEEKSPQVKTIIKATDNTAVISRSGDTKSIMKIVPDESHETVYQTAQLSFDMTVCGISVENRLESDYLKIEYILKNRFGDIGKQKVEISLEEV